MASKLATGNKKLRLQKVGVAFWACMGPHLAQLVDISHNKKFLPANTTIKATPTGILPTPAAGSHCCFCIKVYFYNVLITAKLSLLVFCFTLLLLLLLLLLLIKLHGRHFTTFTANYSSRMHIELSSDSTKTIISPVQK